MDLMSKSDPMIVAFMKTPQGAFVEVGRTEMIQDNLNPKFIKPIMIDYRFEEIQTIRFACYDVDNNSANLNKQDFIGEVVCKVADLVTAKEQKFTRILTHPSHSGKRGTINIVSEEVRELSYQVQLQFSGRHLDKKDFFGKSDPFFIISRALENNQWTPVIKSEAIMKTLDPKWKPFVTSVQNLCNGDYDRPLLFDCYDWNRSGSHELIGSFKTTLKELLDTKGEKREYELFDTKKNKKKNSGYISVVQCNLIKSFTFLEYLSGGCELSLIVAIDFTASNGNPQFANSLHYRNPYQANEYVTAISSVGSILADYDYDKNFPVYGFGAKLPPTRQVSHCFPLNGNWNNPEVPGVQGILDIYYRALDSVELHGPTIFSQVLKTAAQIASTHNSQERQKYYVLLIITDGIINDMDGTIDEIVKANDLPLSVVIVGVGNADFANMEVLDADDTPLRSTQGVFAKRDIVQFVPMIKYRNADPALLAREVLAEIPQQLVSYMKSRGFEPNPPANRMNNPQPMSPPPVTNFQPNTQFPMNYGVPTNNMPPPNTMPPPQSPPPMQTTPSNYDLFTNAPQTPYSPSAPPNI